MTHRVIYQIECHEGAWSISFHDEVVASFMRRDRAVRFADLIAKRNYQRDGIPAVVRLREAGELVDISLHGDRDPAAKALAWIRHVSALRGQRDSAQNDVPSDAPSDVRRRA